MISFPVKAQPETDEHGTPALPEPFRMPDDLAAQASPVLDAIIAYFRYWATRSYDGYHEAVALWVLSTIAARRVYLPWRNGMWTTLYVMLVADSTVNAKTTAASYGYKVIDDCGLSFLLAPDETTPQKLLSKMSGHTIPRNYSTMTYEEREYFTKKLAFSGQKGWIYDEFGDMLQEIVKGKGSSAQFYKLFKQLYDNKKRFVYDTITRGEEEIKMPSLSILGTTPLSSLRPIAGPDSAMWTDGAIARGAWIVSPDQKPLLQSAPDGEAVIPADIKYALQRWHERLGTTPCQVVEDKDETGKVDYHIERGDLPQRPVYWTGSGIREAHEQYYGALATLVYDYQLDERYKATYGRLPDMALKIAMLLASLENNDQMDMRHWARGQQIAERWRTGFHVLVNQLTRGGELKTYGALEEKVIEEMTAKLKPGEKVNSRRVAQLGSSALRQAGSPEVRKVLNELADAGQIGKSGQSRTALYWILDPTENITIIPTPDTDIPFVL